MAEMTPELWDVWWRDVLNALRPQARKQMSIDNWRNIGRVMEEKIVRAAVAAEHKRTKEACAKRLTEIYAEIATTDFDIESAITCDREKLTLQDAANVGYAAALFALKKAIRAMPEPGAERGKEEG